MKFTVIGHWGGFPKAGEASSGYLIQHNGFNMLVDCGSAVMSNLQHYVQIEDMDCIVLSHYHYDHIADVGPMQYGVMIKTKIGQTEKPLLIYGHPYDSGNFSKLSMEPYTKAVEYRENKDMDIGPFMIGFCETRHPVKCFAMRISDGQSSIVYTADTSYTEELKDFSKGADLLVCECNLYKNQDGSVMGHMNSRDAARLARSAGVKELLLTHLPHYGNINELLEDAKANFQGKVELAQSGWTWER